jgi:hypothetical protein
MVKEAVRFVRIIRALDKAHEEFAYRKEVTELFKDGSRATYTVLGGPIWRSCLGCGIEGQYSLRDNKPEGFWKRALEIFQEEGLDVEAFLSTFRVRFEERHDTCSALDSTWVIDWIAENIQ